MKVTIALEVDSRIADDLRVFYAKAMAGNELASCQHPKSMAFIAVATKAIERGIPTRDIETGVPSFDINDVAAFATFLNTFAVINRVQAPAIANVFEAARDLIMRQHLMLQQADGLPRQQYDRSTH